MIELLNMMYSFLVNDLFGSVWIFGVFIVILFVSIVLIARMPKMGLILFPLILLTEFARYSYVIPKWVSVLLWIGIGAIWGAIMWAAIPR